MTEHEHEDEQEYKSAADPQRINFKTAAGYHIEITVNDNIFAWVGDTLNLLKSTCEIPAGRISNIQRKFIQYLSQNDTRRTYQAAAMFRKICSQETDNKVYLKLVKPGGKELK